MMQRARLFGLTAGAILAGALTMPSGPLVSADGERTFTATLRSFNEVPAISSTARGSFRGTLSHDGQSLHYRLSYSGLSAPVTQSHIHFGKSRTNGGIMVWLCQTAAPFTDPAGLAPPCVDEGTVEGTLTSANIVQAGNQGIVAGEFEEFVRALRNDAGYANVHTTAFGSGEIRGQLR
jgi:hypothetical protein